MVDINENITKVCSFYASDCHLVTMLLPHINKSIDEGLKIVTILETDIQSQVEFILSKLRLRNEKKILDIGWTKTEITTEKVEEKLVKGRRNGLNIIVCGTTEYIANVNKIIEECIGKSETERELKIINCYYIEDNLNIKEILSKHKAVLNTAGEKSVKDFEGKINII